MIERNKVVLVTGSSKGIGASIVREFAKSGYIFVINYNHSEKEAKSLFKELTDAGYAGLCIKADVSDEKEVDKMFTQIEEKFGGVDVLINNAGIDKSNLFGKNSIEIFKETLNVNLLGAYICSLRAKDFMVNQKYGRIVNISSTNGMNTYYPMSIEYDASKAALNSLTHNLSMALSPYVNVNGVAPGFIGTESELEGYDEEFLKQETEKIFKKRYGEPSEVAALVKFLCSNKAEYINNQIIKIDGGQYGD